MGGYKKPLAEIEATTLLPLTSLSPKSCPGDVKWLFATQMSNAVEPTGEGGFLYLLISQVLTLFELSNLNILFLQGNSSGQVWTMTDIC